MAELSTPWPPRALARVRLRRPEASPAALVLACAVPLIFLYPGYQPSFTVHTVTVDLSDLAVLAVVVAALAAGVRHGFGALAGARAIWTTAGAFLALVLVSIAWARAADPTYSLTGNLISALKFVEYAVLAPAAALILRRPADRRALYGAVAAWALAITVIGALQFVGEVKQVYGRLPGRREPSYLDEHDFGALSGAALSLAFAALLLRRERVAGAVAAVAGGFGLAIAAALDSVGSTWVAALALIAFARRRARVPVRRALAVVLVCGLATVAAVTLRSSAIGAFLRFLGVETETAQTTSHVQSFSQRTLLGYIGLEIWLHHPLIGVGWQESKRPHAFDPYLAAARRRYGASEPAQAFPSPQHMWGVQNGIVQTLSDLGLLGLAVLLAFVFSVVRSLVRVALRGPPELLHEALVAGGWLIVGFAVFTGTGLIPGVTVDAQIWLGIGLLVALAHEARRSEQL